MKKLIATLMIAGSTLGLAACGTTSGNVDTAPPYADERTASHATQAVAAVRAPVKAERVFRSVQSK